MIEFLQAAGYFVYPLAACSVIGVFIIFERLFALRASVIIPDDLAQAIIEGRTVPGGSNSVLGRIMRFAEEHPHDEEAVKAFARLEVSRMERGFAFLEIIISAAPLLGLLGTVVGLYQVFGAIPETGVPDQAVFTKGIALALVTTVLGLVIAIPCLVGSGYLHRRVEVFAVKLETLIERLYARQAQTAPNEAPDRLSV